MKPTEGPWRLEPADVVLDPRKCLQISGKNWEGFALVVTEMDSPSDSAEGLSNAHILWAARDAVEALRLHQAYEVMPTDRGGKGGPKGLAWQAYLDARAVALAKAEGRA